jgi:hypothetical protein
MLGSSLFTRSRALQGLSGELKSELFAGPSSMFRPSSSIFHCADNGDEAGVYRWKKANIQHTSRSERLQREVVDLLKMDEILQERDWV